MVTKTHRQLSALSLKHAFDDQRSFFSHGFQKIFVQPPKCIVDNDDDDASSFSSDEQFSPSVSLTPSTSSYSVPSSWCSSVNEAEIESLILSLGVVFVWLHIQLQTIILLQEPLSTTTISSLSKVPSLPKQQQWLSMTKNTNATITTSTFDPQSFLPSRYPGPDMPLVNDLVKNQVSIETSELWHKHEQLPRYPSSRRQRFNYEEDSDEEEARSKERQAIHNLAQDVLAYLEESNGNVVPELEALRPQLQNFIDL
ncbi:hypothetical protein INT45_013671 [Circinella minor]|uniref:Uncharacterized protein n=1 Tax=Circinella minor TaxID=1195481 RepID=A0A8H7VM02_9FUNG|nr:hypothetical protein INT45_013671 [Circinella minor]